MVKAFRSSNGKIVHIRQDSAILWSWDLAKLDFVWKIAEKLTFHGIGKIIHFLSAEKNMLGGLVRKSLQFWGAKFAFSEHRISIF